jgi:AAA domain, putative AbiEii toxin, Type IV TA system
MTGKSKALRFTRLALTNWKNFRSTEVRLERRAFFVGPNASGKSNLLDAFRFLRDLVRPNGGGLGAALAERGGLSRVRCLEARRPSHVGIEVDVGTDEAPSLWTYLLEFTRYKKEKLVTVQREIVRHDGREVLAHVRGGSDDALAYSQTMIEQVLQNKVARELAQFFATIRYSHVVPQIVRDRDRARSFGEDHFGGDLLRQMNEMPKKSRIPRLRRMSDALGVAVPQFKNLDLVVDDEGRPHLVAEFHHWRARATKQQEDAFSDGTLRLIGLLWAIGERGGPLLLEEPELSLHDELAAQIPNMIARMQRLSGRQVLAATHSYALLSSNGIGAREVHRLVVDNNGSRVVSAFDDMEVSAMVKGGMTVGDSVMTLARPADLGRLQKIDVVVD